METQFACLSILSAKEREKKEEEKKEKEKHLIPKNSIFVSRKKRNQIGRKKLSEDERFFERKKSEKFRERERKG